MPTAFFWMAASSDEDVAQIVLFLIFVLIVVVARLVKKAAKASKPPSVGGASQPRVPSLSDFLRRVKEISEETEKTSSPYRAEPERPQPRPGGAPVPPPPRRATVGTRQPTRSVSMPQPSLRRKREGDRPREEPLVSLQRQPGETMEQAAESRLEVTLGTAPGVRVSTPQPLSPGPAEGPTHEPYAVAGHVPGRLGDILREAISGSELRKGIILSEILGRPRALRARRPAVRRKAPG